MYAQAKIAAAVLCVMMLGIPAAQSEDYLPSTDIFVELGTAEGDFATYPRDLKLRIGDVYRLVLYNPSPDNHVVVAPDFGATAVASGVWKLPQRVAQPKATVTGGIELRPGERRELYVVPFKEGRYKLFCEERLHTASGMEIKIDVMK